MIGLRGVDPSAWVVGGVEIEEALIFVQDAFVFSISEVGPTGKEARLSLCKCPASTAAASTT